MWTLQAENLLLGPDTPRVLSSLELERIASTTRPGIARATLFKWIKRLVSAGRLVAVSRGLYLNRMASPLVTAAEAAQYIRSGAIVSMHSVLGELSRYPS